MHKNMVCIIIKLKNVTKLKKVLIQDIKSVYNNALTRNKQERTPSSLHTTVSANPQRDWLRVPTIFLPYFLKKSNNLSQQEEEKRKCHRIKEKVLSIHSSCVL